MQTPRAAYALLFLLCATVAGCAYPRRSTPMTRVEQNDRFAPSEAYTFRLIGGELPQKRKGDLSWDKDGGPDPYVQIYRDDELIFESPTAYDTLEPQWNYRAEENLYLPSSSTIRIQLWDRDDVEPNPAGVWSGSGLPATALPGATARVDLESGAKLTFEIGPPVAYRGTGITSYEIRPDEIVALEIVPNSPAGRAGLKINDRILQIGERSVADMKDAQAMSALALADQEKAKLIVLSNGGERRELTFDNGRSYPIK